MKETDFEKISESCLKKQEEIVRLFSEKRTFEEKYQLLIDMGKKQTALDASEKREENRVKGCQSIMYVKIWEDRGCIYFQTEADALISAGLGELVRMAYSGECAEVILGCPPTYIERIGLAEHLSPSRVNGLSALISHIRRKAMDYLIKPSS